MKEIEFYNSLETLYNNWKNDNNKKYKFISTFSGAGLSSIGLQAAGFKELAFFEIDKHAKKCLSINFPNIPIFDDITQIDYDNLLNKCNIKKGDLDLLEGSPPCQGFSVSGNRNDGDSRNDLTNSFLLLAKELQPKVISIENVTGLTIGKMKAFLHSFIISIKNLLYTPYVKILSSYEYGIPQVRKRLFIIAIKNSFKQKFYFPEPEKKRYTYNDSFYQFKNKYFLFDNIGKTEKVFLDRVSHGQSLSKVHPNKSFFNYIFINPLRPCPTITRTMKLIHPSKGRKLSVSELMRLSSIPDEYLWPENSSIKSLYARIGNGVPPLLSFNLGLSIKKMLDSFEEQL